MSRGPKQPWLEREWRAFAAVVADGLPEADQELSRYAFLTGAMVMFDRMTELIGTMMEEKGQDKGVEALTKLRAEIEQERGAA